MKALLAFIILIFFIIYFIKEPVVKLDNGTIYAPNEPTQQKIDNSSSFTYYKDYRYKITPLYKYDIEAKILSRKRYKKDGSSEVSPIDFALGWGKMSDEFYATHEKFKLRQQYRWYVSEYKEGYHLSYEYLNNHISNTHIIPASKEIEKQVLKVKKGSIVNIKGYLVKVNRNDGWNWTSSTSRKDSGNGACEVFYVESINIIKG